MREMEREMGGERQRERAREGDRDGARERERAVSERDREIITSGYARLPKTRYPVICLLKLNKQSKINSGDGLCI